VAGTIAVDGSDSSVLFLDTTRATYTAAAGREATGAVQQHVTAADVGVRTDHARATARRHPAHGHLTTPPPRRTRACQVVPITITRIPLDDYADVCFLALQDGERCAQTVAFGRWTRRVASHGRCWNWLIWAGRIPVLTLYGLFLPPTTTTVRTTVGTPFRFEHHSVKYRFHQRRRFPHRTGRCGPFTPGIPPTAPGPFPPGHT